MSSTTTTTRKSATASKAAPVRKVTLSDAARKSLGIETVTAESAREDYGQGLDSLARVAFRVYALQTGLAGPKMSVRDIVSTIGIKSVGTVSNLNRAGAILNRAGAGASKIARDAVTVCQTHNAKQTASLDTLTGRDLVKAVTALAAAGRASDADRKRAARPAGTGTDKATPKATPDAGADTATNIGRMTVALQMLNKVTRDQDDDSRDAILAACDKAASLLADIVAAYSTPIADIVATVNATPKAATPKARARKAATPKAA